jgi:hypothetical protein
MPHTEASPLIIENVIDTQRTTLGSAGGVEQRHRTTLGGAEEGATLTGRRVHDGLEVVDPLVEGRDRPTGSDRPVPRLSHRTSRENDARRPNSAVHRGLSQYWSTSDTNPGTNTMSDGPSPTTW